MIDDRYTRLVERRVLSRGTVVVRVDQESLGRVKTCLDEDVRISVLLRLKLGISSELVVFSFDLDIQHGFVEVSLSPCLFQFLYFVVVQSSTDLLFQFFATDFCADLLCLLVLVLRLKASLHTQTDLCCGSDLVCISTDRRWGCVGINAEICVAHRTEGEETRLCFGG